MTEFNGILPALVTPFDREGRFDARAFGRLLERVYAADVHGVYINGSTGEGLLQSAAQRQQVAEAAVGNSPPGKQVIVHVGAASTADAVELARHAARAGATPSAAYRPSAAIPSRKCALTTRVSPPLRTFRSSSTTSRHAITRAPPPRNFSNSAASPESSA